MRSRMTTKKEKSLSGVQRRLQIFVSRLSGELQRIFDRIYFLFLSTLYTCAIRTYQMRSQIRRSEQISERQKKDFLKFCVGGMSIYL